MEKILKILGAERPFNNNVRGDLSDEGMEAYGKLLDVLFELNRIGVINKSLDKFEMQFDEIIRLGL